MSLRIKCPSCKTVNTVDDDDRGRKVRCQECDQRISVPAADDDAQAAIQDGPKVKAKSGRARDRDDDDDEVRPRIRRREKSSGGSSTLLLLLGGGGVLLFCLCCGGGGLTMILLGTPEQQRVAVKPLPPLPAEPMPPLVQVDRKKPDPNQNFKIAGKGKMILNQPGRLAFTDPLDPTPGGVAVKARMKVHPVQMQAGKTYVITLRSQEFDAYLRVESPTGQGLAEDDDSGGGLDAQIVFRPTLPGMYRIIATSFNGAVGQYRLEIQEAD